MNTDIEFRTRFLRLMKENNLNRPKKVLTEEKEIRTITNSDKKTK